MYTLLLDLDLKFVPPMAQHGTGIVLTRAIPLPFPPSSGLRVCGASLDECPDPMGFCLDDLTWDVDREVFLARTQIISHDEPLAFVADTIRSWLGRGWSLGSFADSYGDDTNDGEAVSSDAGDDDSEYQELEKLHTLAKTRRPREFNRFFNALIRVLSEAYNNLEVAYAMDRTGRLIEEEKPGREESALSQKWRAARREYLDLSQEEQFAWQDKVEKYPTIEKSLGLVARP